MNQKDFIIRATRALLYGVGPVLIYMLVMLLVGRKEPLVLPLTLVGVGLYTWLITGHDRGIGRSILLFGLVIPVFATFFISSLYRGFDYSWTFLVTIPVLVWFVVNLVKMGHHSQK